MSVKNILAATALGVGLAGGGVFIANAATTATTTASTAAVASSSASTTQGSQAQGGDRGANSNDKTITGTNADKATAAVTAKHSGFKVTLVQQDPDGSYDVHGTLNGSSVMYNVTTDFQVSTDNTLGMVRGSDAAQSNGSSAASNSSASSSTASSAS
ncbi:MAG: hypothetical protein LBI11_05765 [Streptococcaceae bacterium]|jgi:hypothetical protein|nr:hypothetical protein [Streptococcaceae bacterium]